MPERSCGLSRQRGTEADHVPVPASARTHGPQTLGEGVGRIEVAQVHGHHLGAGVHGADVGERPDGPGETGQIVMPVDAVTLAEGLLQQHDVERDALEQVEGPRRPRSGVGGVQDAVPSVVDQVEHGLAERMVLGAQHRHGVAVHGDAVAGADRGQYDRGLVGGQPVGAHVDHRRRPDHLEWPGIGPASMQEEGRREVIAVRMGDQHGGDRSQVGAEALRIRLDGRPGVQQQASVHQGAGRRVQFTAPAQVVARPAPAEGVGPAIGRARAQQEDVHVDGVARPASRNRAGSAHSRPGHGGKPRNHVGGPPPDLRPSA